MFADTVSEGHTHTHTHTHTPLDIITCVYISSPLFYGDLTGA